MTLLLNCSAVDQRDVICFLWSEGVKTSEIYKRMLAQYGEYCRTKKNVLLLHNNTCPCHMTAIVQATRQIKFELLPHFPYCQGQAPSDYFIFWPLKEALCGWRWAVMMKLRTRCIHDFICNQKLSSQIGRIRRLVNHYKIHVENVVIMLGNDTLCVCHRLLYTKYLTHSLSFWPCLILEYRQHADNCIPITKLSSLIRVLVVKLIPLLVT